MEKRNLLTQYLQGEMSENELDDITKVILKDHFEESETKEKWKKLLKEKYRVNSFENFNDFTEFKKKKKKSKIFLISVLSGIAASLLIFVIFTLNTASHSEAPLANVLNEYYSSPVQFRNTKGVSSLPDKRQLAFEYYNNKDYKSASTVLEEIVTNNEEFIEDDHFYLGLSYLYQKEAKESAILFKKMLNKDNLQRKDAIIWFLSLALIEDEQYEEAQIYLDEVVKWKGNSGKTRKANQAKELLSIIKGL